MEQESCNNLLLADKSRLVSDASDLVSLRLTQNQMKQIYLALNIFQAMYGREKFTKNLSDADLGIFDTLQKHGFDVPAMRLDAESYLKHEFDELRQQIDQSIYLAEKMERSYAS